MLYAQQTFAHFQDIYTWDDLPAGVRVTGNITLDDIQSILTNQIESTIGIPVVFARDQIQSGGKFSKQHEDCLVMKNAEHPNDYFHFVFTVRPLGKITTISYYRSGSSLLSGKHNTRDERKASNNLFQNVLGALTKTDERGIQEEYDYYDLVKEVIRQSFC